MKMLTGLVAAAVVAGPLAYSSQAVLVTNVTTNTVLFSDNFEDGTLGQEPGPAQVGSWMALTTGTVGGTLAPNSPSRIEDLASAGFAAYESDQFFKIQYRTSPSNANILLASDTFATGSAGDLIELTLAIRVDALSGSVQLMSGSTNIARMFFAHSSHSNNDIAGKVVTAGNVDSGLTHTSNDWNEVVLRYIQNSDTFSFSVNGSSFVNATAENDGGMVDRIAFRTNGGVTQFYIDAIPEPASLALLGLGGLAMLRRQKRNLQ